VSRTIDLKEGSNHTKERIKIKHTRQPTTQQQFEETKISKMSHVALSLVAFLLLFFFGVCVCVQVYRVRKTPTAGRKNGNER
jgi:ABC-type proline/glycine betaine transport system permease subunit